jgi:hypothetical protein
MSFRFGLNANLFLLLHAFSVMCHLFLHDETSLILLLNFHFDFV